jgi:hypothetical protein
MVEDESHAGFPEEQPLDGLAVSCFEPDALLPGRGRHAEGQQEEYRTGLHALSSVTRAKGSVRYSPSFHTMTLESVEGFAKGPGLGDSRLSPL